MSIEPPGAMWERAEGMEQLQQKGKKWQEKVIDFHGSEIGDPIVGGNHFSCIMTTDVTFKEQGRVKFSEVCVYKVEDEKIVLEQFFY